MMGRDSLGRSIIWALALSSISGLIRWLLDPVLGDEVVFVMMVPAVAGAVIIGGVRAAVLTAALTAGISIYFFKHPRQTLDLQETASLVGLVSFLAASGIVIAIGHHLQKSIARSRNAEHLLESIMDGLPALVSLIDSNYRYCLVNAEYTRWFSISEPELLGKSVEEVLGRDAFLKVKPRLDRALGGEKVEFREHLAYAHGGERWVQITYRPHLNSQDLIDGVTVLVLDISDQYRAEQALAEREREFRGMFELNATGSASVDATTGRFLLVNEKFCEMTGYTCEELFQKTFSDITHPEDREQDLEKYREVLQSRALNFEAEKRYLRKDGAVRWVIVRGTIIRDDAGKAVRSLATIMDLTEWKENQQALAESEERLRLALDAGHFGAWEWIIPENRVIWSDRLYEIHGVTPKEFTGDAEQFRRLVHPEDAAMVFDSAQDTLKSKAPYRVEYRAVRPDGEIRWHWTTAQVFYDKAGNPFKMVGVTSDITDRKHIELQLRESEERLRLAQRAAKVNTWEWDLATNKISFSEGLYDLLSLPAGAEPPTMEEWRNYIHPDDLVRFANTMPDIQRRGGHFNMEFRVVRASGEIRWVLSIGTTEKDAQGNPIRMFGVNLDITERKKAEVLLQSQAQHLEELVRARTERLQEVIMELESFSYTIAHDLRGPLRAMNGFASALEEDYSAQLDNLARDYIRRITGAAERMDRLICDVLDYSKITRQPFEPEPVALDPLIDGIIETYPGLNTDDGALVQVERPLPVVLGTASLLVQCFSNLIGNAVKFVPEGITPRIQIHAEPRENGKVRIWVEDNGIGISADNHDRIFGLFQRLDKKFDGTGIGLAIVSRAVDRMGGSVGLESTEGTGSRFWVDLNLAECSTGIRMSDPANAFQRNLLP